MLHIVRTVFPCFCFRMLSTHIQVCSFYRMLWTFTQDIYIVWVTYEIVFIMLPPALVVTSSHPIISCCLSLPNSQDEGDCKVNHRGVHFDTYLCSKIMYGLGPQPYVFESHWLNSNICVAHFHFWQCRALLSLISQLHSMFSLFSKSMKQSS